MSGTPITAEPVIGWNKGQNGRKRHYLSNSSYKWTVARPATYAMSTNVPIPTRTGGLISVIIMVIVHLATVLITLIFFLSRTKASLIGNAWQAVAHVVSDETLPVLVEADGKKDKELKEIMDRSGWNAKRTGIIRRRHNGKNEFGPK
ncbi:hypothetical protein F4819DRAFT_492855 [Hypoxylon fuscum]|nr:hypothetical protein F4819DRAFT_492855 [Hypoxylon fuscum]